MSMDYTNIKFKNDNFYGRNKNNHKVMIRFNKLIKIKLSCSYRYEVYYKSIVIHSLPSRSF